MDMGRIGADNYRPAAKDVCWGCFLIGKDGLVDRPARLNLPAAN
jgi:hypothetical protein